MSIYSQQYEHVSRFYNRYYELLDFQTKSNRTQDVQKIANNPSEPNTK